MRCSLLSNVGGAQPQSMTSANVHFENRVHTPSGDLVSGVINVGGPASSRCAHVTRGRCTRPSLTFFFVRCVARQLNFCGCPRPLENGRMRYPVPCSLQSAQKSLASFGRAEQRHTFPDPIDKHLSGLVLESTPLRVLARPPDSHGRPRPRVPAHLKRVRRESTTRREPATVDQNRARSSRCLVGRRRWHHVEFRRRRRQ